MKRERSRQGRLLPLLLMLILGLLATPVAEGLASPRESKTIDLNSTVYLTTATLKPLFQKEIDKRTVSVASTTINGMTSKMTPPNQGWANQMANALINPKATITDMQPQKDGILTTMRVALYPGDPFPLESKMLIKFSVKDTSTIQISSQHQSGPQLVSDGPLTTLKVSMGKLQSIAPTPSCGEAALALNLQFPILLDQVNAPVNNAPASGTPTPSPTPTTPKPPTQPQGELIDAYIELPQGALDKLAQGIDKVPVSDTMRAQNLHASVKDKTLTLTSDLSLWETGLIVASTTTTVQPSAQNGQVHFQVSKTELTVAFFTFDGNRYNEQIQTLLNEKLGSALAGKFTASGAAIGNNTHVPCAADDSLMLTGKTSMGG
jgi:hypothetical protein